MKRLAQVTERQGRCPPPSVHASRERPEALRAEIDGLGSETEQLEAERKAGRRRTRPSRKPAIRESRCGPARRAATRRRRSARAAGRLGGEAGKPQKPALARLYRTRPAMRFQRTP
jgi:hypothetical protein